MKSVAGLFLVSVMLVFCALAYIAYSDGRRTGAESIQVAGHLPPEQAFCVLTPDGLQYDEGCTISQIEAALRNHCPPSAASVIVRNLAVDAESLKEATHLVFDVYGTAALPECFAQQGTHVKKQ